MPRSSWSATVQIKVYRPRGSFTRICPTRPGRTTPVAARGVPRGPTMRRSWSSSPMFLSCSRSLPAGMARRLDEKRN